MIKRASEQRDESPVSILIWGGAKTGKTFLAGTLGNEMLFISNGLGSKTITSDFFRDTVKADPYLIEIPYDDLKKEKRSIELVEDAIYMGIEKMSDVKYIVIDDASAGVRSMMINAMEYNKDSKRTSTLDRAERFETVIPEINDYQTEMNMTAQAYAKWISDCKFAGKHLIVLAHEKNIYKSAGKIGEQPILIKTLPAFNGVTSNPDLITGLFDWVLHTKKLNNGQGTKYYVETLGDNTLIAGIRDAQHLFNSEISNPNLLKMLSAAKQGKKYNEL